MSKCPNFERELLIRDYPLDVDGVKFAYGAFANTTYGTGVQNKNERHGMAAIGTGSASIDEMWESMGDEVVEFDFGDGEVLGVRKRKEGQKYPFGGSCNFGYKKKAPKSVDINKMDDDELEKFVYRSTDKYYDIMESLAVQKASNVPGLGVLYNMKKRDKFFDFLYIVQNNPLTKEQLSIVLNCGIATIDSFMFTGACLGMMFYNQKTNVNYRGRPDGDLPFYTKKKNVVCIGGWGVLDKKLVLGGGRFYGLQGIDLMRAKLPENAKQRQKVLDELHKVSIGLRSEYDEKIGEYRMDVIGDERNGFRRSERLRKAGKLPPLEPKEEGG